MRPDRFCNAIYFWCLQRVGADGVEEFNLRLAEPFPGQRVSEGTAEVEMSGFQQFQQQVSGS